MNVYGTMAHMLDRHECEKCVFSSDARRGGGRQVSLSCRLPSQLNYSHLLYVLLSQARTSQDNNRESELYLPNYPQTPFTVTTTLSQL